MTQQTQTLTAPAIGTATWQIDPSHSLVEFSVRHMMIATVKGRFADVSGTIRFDQDDPASTEVDVTVEAASIDTRNEHRDAHLRSPDFFDAEQYPTLRFVSRAVEQVGEDRYRVTGDLTIRDVTREIALDARFFGIHPDPYGGTRAGFSATGEIDRHEFGLNWNQAIESGGVVVGPRVKITLEVEAVRS
jgi:polyisoprenoid-binding protein YceI